MNALRRRFFTFIITLILSLFTQTAFAQDNRKQAEDKVWMNGILRYYRLSDKASPQEIEKILELRSKILAPELSFKDRLSVYAEAYTIFLRWLGNGSIPQQTVAQVCIQPMIATHFVVTNPDYKRFDGATTPLGELGHVEKMGRGPIPMILIHDYGTDWTLYRSFMERNRERYTMYAVTLPGFGDAPAPPRPEFYDPSATPFWDGAEQAVVKLIEKNKLVKPVVVGTQAGAYLATRIALNHPDKTRGVVLLNGLVKMPLIIPDNQKATMNLKERHRLIAERPDLTGLIWEFSPLVILTPTAAEKTIGQVSPAFQRVILELNTRDAERGKVLYIDFMTKTDPRAISYFMELAGTDLTDGLKNLKVPTLVIPSLHDADSPAANIPAMQGSADQWNEMKQLYPSIPLTVAPFENTRNYAVEEAEAPLEIDRAITAFIAGKPVEAKRMPDKKTKDNVKP